MTFAPGETAKTVVVDLVDDAVAESLERFNLMLSNPRGATLGDGVAVADIGANDSTALAQPRITAAPRTVGEGDSYVDVVVSLSAPGQNAISVNYSTQDSLADRFADFVNTADTLFFAVGLELRHRTVH